MTTIDREKLRAAIDHMADLAQYLDDRYMSDWREKLTLVSYAALRLLDAELPKETKAIAKSFDGDWVTGWNDCRTDFLKALGLEDKDG